MSLPLIVPSFPTLNHQPNPNMLLLLLKTPLLVLVLLADPNPTMSSSTNKDFTNKDLVASVGREGSKWTELHPSPWLKKVAKEEDPRASGCWNRPWICNLESSSGNGDKWRRERKNCCRNRCLKVSSDVNNCGVCGIRCPFRWQCCNGLCLDTNINPFHCGNCFHLCRSGSFCLYGLCGYALPLTPLPIHFPSAQPTTAPNSHPPLPS